MATTTQITQSASSAASLSASVSSLRSSLSLLDSSISILDAGISDFPRLSTMLSTTRHFELTPASTLAVAQASLASELGPAIAALLSRVERECARLERRESALLARSELLEGRLGMGNGHKAGSGAASRPERRMGATEDEKALRLRSLQQKKERLGYAVERLTLQSQQRQRQLRMSVNVSAP